MKNKLFIIFIFLLSMLVISAVSANENTTEDISADINKTDSILEDSGDKEDVSSDDNTSKISAANETCEITSSNVTGYSSFKTTVSAKLTSNNVPLVSKSVKILINNVTYTKTTDNDGKVSVDVTLQKGVYDALFTFDGDGNTSGTTTTSIITIKQATKTSLKVGDKYISYRQGSKCLFYVKLVNANGKAIKNQYVTIKVNGKTYRVKTNSNGNAKIYLNLKKGKYKIKFSFEKSEPYLSSSGSFKIKVKSKMKKGDGYWLWPAHMKTINLKSLSKKGTRHVLLHVQAISVHGKSSVVSFIKKAHKHGIKVHLWMQVAYSGGKWVSLVNGKGKLKYSFMNKKIAQAKKFAKIKGVDGIHFDYLRYGGTAHKHPNAVKSINYFVKKASTKIHKIKPNCIVSGALMPEPSAMHYYYGQDVPTMSRYMDALIPMVYKGNYHQSIKWIKSVTKTFVKQSNGAQIWTGLQSYYSDSNTNKLPQKSLLKDANAAESGGAKGIVLFRIGISCNFNFKKV